MFLLVLMYEEPEQFFHMAQEMRPDGAVIDLLGAADYFLIGPVCEEEFKEGLSLWFEGRDMAGNRRCLRSSARR